MSLKQCGLCAHWQKSISGVGPAEIVLGECRLEPPVFINALYHASSAHDSENVKRGRIWQAYRYPITESGEWCRHYEPREELSGNTTRRDLSGLSDDTF
jgi:hypothetical protein